METTARRNLFDDSISARKICWASILGGVTIALTLGFVLNLLGVALGFAAVNPDMESVKTLSTMSIVWIFVAGVIAMFTAGWVTTHLSGVANATKGYWQGFIVAGVTTLIMLGIATTSLGSFIGGSFNIMGKIVGASGSIAKGTASAASGIASNAPNMNKDDVISRAKEFLPSSLSPLIDQLNYEADSFMESVNNDVANATPSAADLEAKAKAAKEKAEFYRKKVTPALINFLQSIGTDNYEQSKKDLVNALAEASGKPQADIENQVAAWQKTFEDAKEKAVQAAKDAAMKTASMLSHFAFIYFFVILISIVSAGMGGMVAARKES